MSKRKVQFNENIEMASNVEKVGNEECKKSARFKEKHSLDSDEEDAGDKYDVMQDDDIEGQEDATIDFDEGTKITPFNMREEMEEGHFDKEGTYIFKKEREIQDNWIENIDWVKIKEGEKKKDDDDDEQVGLAEDLEDVDEIRVYRDMITLMKPGETILKAIRRLGGSGKSSSASQRWKNKKAGTTVVEVGVDKEAMLKLTELADKMVNTNIEIYHETYEKLAFKIKVAEDEEEKKKTIIPEGTADDDAMDMFAQSFDDKGDGEPPAKAAKISSTEPSTTTDDGSMGDGTVPSVTQHISAGTSGQEISVIVHDRAQDDDSIVLTGGYLQVPAGDKMTELNPSGDQSAEVVQVIMQDDGQILLPEGQLLQFDSEGSDTQFIQVTGEDGQNQIIQIPSQSSQPQIIQDGEGNLIQLATEGQAQLVEVVKDSDGNIILPSQGDQPGESFLESIAVQEESIHDKTAGEHVDAEPKRRIMITVQQESSSGSSSYVPKLEEEHELHVDSGKLPLIDESVFQDEHDSSSELDCYKKEPVDVIDHSKPIEVTSDTIVTIKGKKCVLRMDPETNSLVAYPYKSGPPKRRGRPKKDASPSSVLTPKKLESKSEEKDYIPPSSARGLSEQENSAAEGLLGLSDAEGVRRSHRKKKKPITYDDYETEKVEGMEEDVPDDGEKDSEMDDKSIEPRRGPGRPPKNVNIIETTSNKMKNLLHSMGYPVKRGRGRPRRSPLPGTQGNNPTLLIPGPHGQGIVMAQIPESLQVMAPKPVEVSPVDTLQDNPPIVIQNADGSQTHVKVENIQIPEHAIAEIESEESQQIVHAPVTETEEVYVEPAATTAALEHDGTTESVILPENLQEQAMKSNTSSEEVSTEITDQSLLNQKLLPIVMPSKNLTPVKIGLKTAEGDLDKLKCSKCDFQAYYDKQYQDHLETHGDLVLRCKCCSFRTFELEPLKSHYMRVHPKCICTDCGFTAEHAYIVKRHSQRHKNNGCACEICGKLYKDQYILKMHIKNVHLPAEVLYGCNICSKKFTRKAHLKRHLRTHDPDKPYKCPHCEYRGTERSDVSKHVLIHEEPKFSCQVCGKIFRHSKNLDLHLKRHKGQRDYKCGVCDFYGYTFTDIRKHIERKHADSKHMLCRRCGATFKSELMLRAHFKTCDIDMLEDTLVVGDEEEGENKTTISIPASQLGPDGQILLDQNQVNITVEQVSLPGTLPDENEMMLADL